MDGKTPDPRLEPPVPAVPPRAPSVGCATSLGRAFLGALIYVVVLGAAYSIAMAGHSGMSEDAQGGAAMVLVLMLPVHIVALAAVCMASFSTKRWPPLLWATGAALVSSLLWYLQCFR